MATATEYQYAIFVNQKLAFARTLINAAGSLGDGSLIERHNLLAYFDGALSQLHDALVFLLLEIATQQQNNLKIEFGCFSVVLRQLVDSGIENDLTREVNELAQQNSWLSALLNAKNNPLQLSALLDSQTKSPSSGSFLLATDAVITKGPDVTLRDWLINVQLLVDRQRSQAVEE
jgi:hypothetical protein